MWGILQSMVISIILIVSAHYIFQYIKNTLTPRKTRDVVNFQLQKYKDMLEEATSKKTELGEHAEEEEYLTYFKDVFQTRSRRDTPFYEPSVAGDDTQSEMGSTVDYARMEEELLAMM